MQLCYKYVHIPYSITYVGDQTSDATAAIIGGTIGGVTLFVVLSILLCVGIWRIKIFKEKWKIRNYSEFSNQKPSLSFNSHHYESELRDMKADGAHLGVKAKICK